MSLRQFNYCNLGQSIADLDIDPAKLCGAGGAENPHLNWQFEFKLKPTKNPSIDYAFRVATAQLYFEVGQKIADARPVFLSRVVHGHMEYWGNVHFTFEFPLDVRRIEMIERRRQGGGLRCRLDVQIQVDEYALIAANEALKRPVIWGLRNADALSLQETVQISQADWIDHVLPGVGYGNVHVLEFPAAPIDACMSLANSFKALKQAEEKHRLGFYDDTVGKCRVALDPFFDYELVDPAQPDTSRKIPVLKRSWEKKLGQATYDWLNKTFSAIKDASNVTHHSPNEHYSQMESQMILAITTAVVAYIARTNETTT